jgi:cellulose synthase operon protein C
MRSRVPLLLLFCCVASQVFAQAGGPKQTTRNADSLAERFISEFDLAGASHQAEARLRHNPGDAIALFVRMETAELEDRPEVVLDSALRLCSLPADHRFQELASDRILQHAGNTRAFHSMLRRVKAASALHNGCGFNLKLALVAAAMDGQSRIDLDQAARSAGLLTHWRIAGPFGHYDNVDFERRWPAELDQLSRQQYASEASESAADGQKKKTAADASLSLSVEHFWFRDGMLSLPEYLSGPGVFYAAGEIEIPARQISRIEVLSSGTYRVFVDGKEALLQDARYIAAPSRNRAALQLRPGRHRVLIKFIADAAPLSIAVHPQENCCIQDERGAGIHACGLSHDHCPASAVAAKPAHPQTAVALEAYTEALTAYFHGDFIAMERLLDSGPDQAAGTAQYLRALLYSAAEEHSPRADAAWKSISAAQPSALLARMKSQESAAARGHSDEARQEAMSILAARPESETALQMAFNLSRSHAEAPALLARLLELHPSCARVADAVKFYSAAAEQDRARQLEQQLSACAPEPLQYARVLSEAGRHGAAAAYLQQIIVKNPLHRAARRFLIEQLVLSGQQSAARLQAQQLHDLAPNARSYARLARDPESVQDSRSRRAAGFTQNHEFYRPYRRDALELVRESAQRSFSGGPAVVLLSDKVIQLQPEGEVSVYVHRITRPLNKDGISRYGEVALPRGADLLELRTIKPSGQIIEPELAQQKPTISMPALEPDDAIEEEYVVHYAELGLAPASATVHVFGSFDAPILFSRLVLLDQPEIRLNIREQAGTPQPLVGKNNGAVVRIWERDNIAQTVAEPFLPSVNLLPTVTVAAAEKTRDRLRDELMDATHIGLRVSEAALQLHLAQAPDEMEKAKRLYRFVTSKIDSTGPDWAGSPAEDTLQNGQGSRTAALLALARAARLQAGLLMARKIGQNCGSPRDLSCYTEPLVRFWFANGEIFDVDAEADDLPFGAIPPTLDTREALLVPLLPEEEKRPEITALARIGNEKPGNEKSVAEGELSFHEGDLAANIQIRLGAARAQEVRSLLRNAGERQSFFEQLAMRLFSGATAVTGSSAHEDDPEQPLEISLHCTVPQFINRQSGALDIGQLVPALGLRALYAKAQERKFPLYIESLFFESAVFHLHLPDNIQAGPMPRDFTEKSEFGDYSVRFVRSARRIDIHRDFHVPVQVIAPEKYAAFAQFARHIDDAERQRIPLEMGKDAPPERQYRVPPATGMLR